MARVADLIHSCLVRSREAAELQELITYLKHHKARSLRRNINKRHKVFFDATALAYVYKYGTLDQLRTLLTIKTLDVNIGDAYGRSPLLLATMGGFEPQIRVLLTDPRIDVDARSLYGETALMAAASHDQAVIMQLLIDHGASINMQDDTARTPLGIASALGHYKCVRVLLAQPRIEVNVYRSPLHRATFEGHVQCVSLLLKHPRIHIYQWMDQRTLVHTAAVNVCYAVEERQASHYSIIVLLMMTNAFQDLHKTDHAGGSAWDVLEEYTLPQCRLLYVPTPWSERCHRHWPECITPSVWTIFLCNERCAVQLPTEMLLYLLSFWFSTDYIHYASAALRTEYFDSFS